VPDRSNPSLSDRDLKRIVTERLDSWGEYLVRHRSTPVLMVSLRLTDRQLILTTVEDYTDADIEVILTNALEAIWAGRTGTR
jgi:hypothetical protein